MSFLSTYTVKAAQSCAAIVGMELASMTSLLLVAGSQIRSILVFVLHEYYIPILRHIRLFHTNPNVPHYANNKAVGVMKPGHVFTIEPMINRGIFFLLFPCYELNLAGLLSLIKDNGSVPQFV